MNENLKKLMDFIVPASVVVSLFFPIGGLIYYFFSVENRIVRLENQVQLLSVTSPRPQVEVPKSSIGLPPMAAAESEVNPVLKTCLDLVKRVAELRTSTVSSGATYLEDYIRDYGCKEIMAKAAVSK
jgi:hypothetical protein